MVDHAMDVRLRIHRKLGVRIEAGDAEDMGVDSRVAFARGEGLVEDDYRTEEVVNGVEYGTVRELRTWQGERRHDGGGVESRSEGDISALRVRIDGGGWRSGNGSGGGGSEVVVGKVFVVAGVVSVVVG